MKKGIALAVLFVGVLTSTSYGLPNMASILNAPQDYEGQTMVFDHAWLDGRILRNPHFGFYCLDLEIGNRHVPGYLYRSQLNFILFSEKAAKQLTADIQKGKAMAGTGSDVELLDRVCHNRAYLVRLTCAIERFQEYWIADVKKVELYGKEGEIMETLDAGVH